MFIAHINRAITSISNRIKELNEETSTEDLIKIWNSQKQHGRAIIWMENNPEKMAGLSQAQQQELLNLKQSFINKIEKS